MIKRVIQIILSFFDKIKNIFCRSTKGKNEVKETAVKDVKSEDVKSEDVKRDYGKLSSEKNVVDRSEMIVAKNIKNKLVYFNIDDEKEKEILDWSIDQLGSFSSVVKNKLYEAMQEEKRRNNHNNKR